MGVGRSKKWYEYNRIEKDFDCLTVSDVKLKVHKSTAENGSEGVFAEEFIPKGTIICESDPTNITEKSISRKINDLLYKGNASEYENNEKVNNTTNVIYVHKDADPITYMLPGTKPFVFIETSKDICVGEELSRYYGIDYWYEFEYREKYGEIIKDGLYPPDYMFIDEYRTDIYRNVCMQVYGKCVDGKYYYVESRMIPKNYYHRIDDFKLLPIFGSPKDVIEHTDKIFGKYEDRTDEQRNECWNYRCLIDVSKKDFSKYEFDEPMILEYISKDGKHEIIKHYRTEYLRTTTKN